MLEREKLVQRNRNFAFSVRRLSRREAEDYLSIPLALEVFATPSIIKETNASKVRKLEECIQKVITSLQHHDLKSVAAKIPYFSKRYIGKNLDRFR